MNRWDILIVLFLGLAAALALRHILIQHKRGGCCDGCEGCKAPCTSLSYAKTTVRSSLLSHTQLPQEEKERISKIL